MKLEKNPYLKFFVEDQPTDEVVENSNVICYSEYKQVYADDTFRSVGIKYVSSGFEYYKIDRKEYKVNEGHFILSNPTPNVAGFIDSKELVKGICIDINSTTVADAFNVLSGNNDIDLEDYEDDKKEIPYFFEHVSFAGTSMLGNRLSRLERQLLDHNYTLSAVNDEWFLEMAEELIREQNFKLRSLNRLKNLKTCTRQEIMRRLLLGKEYMDLHYCQEIDIHSIAKYCCMSEFHFYRSFKEAFNTTPYQYILNKKLMSGFELISQKKSSITDVAFALNFTDVHAFSNAFKKRFGIAPSKLI